MGTAKSINHGQPLQADHSRNFPLLPDFLCINPLPHMPLLASSNTAPNKDMMSKMGQMGI